MNPIIKKQVLELSVIDRLELLNELEDSLIHEKESIEELWHEECERRLKAYDEGSLSTVTEEEFFNSIRSK